MTPPQDMTALLAQAQERGDGCMYTRKPTTCDNRGPVYEPLELHEWCDLCFIRVMRAELESALHCQHAYDAITRAIAEAVGSGDPSGPYWEDGVRWLQQRADAAEADRDRLRSELESALSLAYIGERRFPDLTWKARVEELVPQLRAAEAEVARLRAEMDALKVR